MTRSSLEQIQILKIEKKDSENFALNGKMNPINVLEKGK